jgi:hypothetical protein
MIFCVLLCCQSYIRKPLAPLCGLLWVVRGHGFHSFRLARRGVCAMLLLLLLRVCVCLLFDHSHQQKQS